MKKPIYLALATFLLTTSFSGATGFAGSLIRQTTSHGSAFVLLEANTRGKIVGYSFGRSQDRAQLHVILDLGNGQTEEGWVHYVPDLPERRQTLALYDQNGNATQDVTQAKSLVVLRAGVTAWKSMEHVSQEVTASYKLHLTKTKRAVATTAPASALALVPDSRNWSADCEDFIDADGNFGNWGVAVLNTVNTTSTPTLIGNSMGDIAALCPKYSTFDAFQRANFWVWLGASVAMKESGCDPEVVARGPNGQVVGLWQLDGGGMDRYGNGVCGNINAYDGSSNITCGMKLLDWYTGSDDKNYGKNVYWEGNYWQTLHPGNASQVATNALVQLYTPCH